MALSSDKIASVQEPITSLDLDVQSQQGQQVHSIELNREDLKKLITSLEGANKVNTKMPGYCELLLISWKQIFINFIAIGEPQIKCSTKYKFSIDCIYMQTYV